MNKQEFIKTRRRCIENSNTRLGMGALVSATFLAGFGGMWLAAVTTVNAKSWGIDYIAAMDLQTADYYEIAEIISQLR